MYRLFKTIYLIVAWMLVVLPVYANKPNCVEDNQYISHIVGIYSGKALIQAQQKTPLLHIMDKEQLVLGFIDSIEVDEEQVSEKFAKMNKFFDIMYNWPSVKGDNLVKALSVVWRENQQTSYAVGIIIAQAAKVVLSRMMRFEKCQFNIHWPSFGLGFKERVMNNSLISDEAAEKIIVNFMAKSRQK